MKRSTIHLMLATAAVLVASTAASAQTTPAMTAEIPFSFAVHGKVMPAGVYTVSVNQGERLFRISSVTGTDSVLSGAGALRDPQKNWRDANSGILLFACSDGCVLQEIWTNRGYPAQEVGARRSGNARQPATLATIRLVNKSAK